MLLSLLVGCGVIYLLVKFAIWYLTESNNGYWKQKDVPVALATDMTTYMNLIMGKTSSVDLDSFCYKKYPDAPFVGMMELRRPVLLLRDLELIKRIYVKDFDHFVNRRNFNVDKELSDKFLFNMNDQDWRDLRAAFSPTFTSGKIRKMFNYFKGSGADLQHYVENHRQKTGQQSIELRNIYGRYIMDLIAATAFGIDGKCLVNEESEFMKYGRELMRYDVWRTMKTFCILFTPKLAEFFGVTFFHPSASEFFKGVIARVLKQRRETPGNYKDFVQLMMDAQKSNGKGMMDHGEELDAFEKDAQITPATPHYQITDGNILGNSVVFINAGFEGTETTMTLATYFCALYPDMQTRLRDEIEGVLADFQGDICYDAIAKMNYLDMFITEVLRLYPPFTRTERVVTKEYQIPGTNVVLPVGTVVAFPILQIQRDEKNFPDPEKFDPERFTNENKQARHPYAYMTFGHGPRNCIGMRYALIEVKAGLVQIIKNFDISPTADTHVPLRFENVPMVIKPVKSLSVSLKPRQ